MGTRLWVLVVILVVVVVVASMHSPHIEHFAGASDYEGSNVINTDGSIYLVENGKLRPYTWTAYQYAGQPAFVHPGDTSIFTNGPFGTPMPESAPPAPCQPVVPPAGVNCSTSWNCVDGIPMRVSPSNGMVECATKNGACMQLSNNQCTAWTNTNNQNNFVISPTLAQQYNTIQCADQCGNTNSTCYKAWVQFTNHCLPGNQSVVPS